MKLFRELKRWAFDLSSWRSDNPILTIESYDWGWGSIRLSSRKAFFKLTNAGIELGAGDSLSNNQNDTLASQDDFCLLYEDFVFV